MSFVLPQKILFKHCDPAGIVFYPRFFEMVNDCVEAFFDTVLGYPFEDLHRHGGVPTAEITARFVAPCRHGDQLALHLTCTKLGRSSLGVTIEARCGGALRFETRSTLVLVDERGKPAAWPADLRDKLEKQVREAQDEQ